MRRASGGISAVAIAAVLVALLLTSPANALQVGDKAPDFTLTAPGGKQVKLADLLGKGPVVIYTFIQAFTPT
jgi:peroxiredoxin Q/BCP